MPLEMLPGKGIFDLLCRVFLYLHTATGEDEVLPELEGLQVMLLNTIFT